MGWASVGLGVGGVGVGGVGVGGVGVGGVGVGGVGVGGVGVGGVGVGGVGVGGVGVGGVGVGGVGVGLASVGLASATVIVAISATAVPTVVRVAPDVGGQRALRIGGVDANQRNGQPLRRGGVVPAVTALDAQPALRPRLIPAFGKGNSPPIPIHVVGEGAADPAVRADAVNGVEVGPGTNRHAVDGLVGQRASGAGLDALPTGDAGARPHGIVEIEGDPGLVSLSRAADHVVALDIVAGSDATITKDAGVVVDIDHRVGCVRTPVRSARQVGRILRQIESISQAQEEIVAGGRLFWVSGDGRLIGDQQLGQGGPGSLQLRTGGGHLHALFARPDAGSREGAPAGVHHAHATDTDRVVTLVVAQHRNVDPGSLGRGVDRRPLGGGDRGTVDLQGDGPNGSGRCRRGGQLLSVGRLA